MNAVPPYETDPSARAVGVIATDERIAVVLALAMATRGYKLVAVSDLREAEELSEIAALLAVIEQLDLEMFELLARLGARPTAPPIILMTPLVVAQALEPAALRDLSVAQVLPWPCRPNRIAAALGELGANRRGAAATDTAADKAATHRAG